MEICDYFESQAEIANSARQLPRHLWFALIKSQVASKCLLKLVKNLENAIFLAFVGRGTSDLEIPTFSEAPEARGWCLPPEMTSLTIFRWISRFLALAALFSMDCADFWRNRQFWTKIDTFRNRPSLCDNCFQHWTTTTEVVGFWNKTVQKGDSRNRLSAP